MSEREIAEIPEDVTAAAERVFDDMHHAMINGSLVTDEETGLPALDVADAVAVLARAILAERERCAKVAEGFFSNESDDYSNGQDDTAERIATSIRQGSPK
jgi:hypothetical protein